MFVSSTNLFHAPLENYFFAIFARPTIIIISSQPLLGHCCLHKFHPRCSVLSSMPCRVQADVRRSEISLKGARPCVRRVAFRSLPIAVERWAKMVAQRGRLWSSLVSALAMCPKSCKHLQQRIADRGRHFVCCRTSAF